MSFPRQPHLSPREISVESTDEKISAAWYVLAGISRTKFGLWVDSHEEDAITRSIMNRSFDFPPAFQLMAAMVKPGERVLDLGAHIGTFGLYAAALACEVVAVDASSKNTALLRESGRDNHFDNLRVLLCGISNHSGLVEFVQGGPYGHMKNPFTASPTVSVQAVAVDELLTNLGWNHVDFIKMDIEGSELAAVQGMSQLLAREDAPAILFESNGHALHLFGETPTTLLSAIESFGYHCYLVDPQRQSLIPVKADDLQPGCVEDYLAVKTLPQILSWPLASPLSYNQIVAGILAWAAYDNPHYSAHLGRVLSQPAAASYLSDNKIKSVLYALSTNHNAFVRQSAEWWQPGEVKPAPHYIAQLQWVADWSRLIQSKIKQWLKKV